MDLDRYVEALQGHLMVAAEAGGQDARALAERLTAPLDAATRLVMLELLSDAAAEITVDLAPGSVELRLRGRDPEIIVTAPPPEPPADALEADEPDGSAAVSAELDDGGTARISLRLPESLKVRAEDAAARQSLSVNAWLVRAVAAAVDPHRGPIPGRGQAPSVGSRFTGWAR